jgi:hypothetical protein
MSVELSEDVVYHVRGVSSISFQNTPIYYSTNYTRRREA